MSNDLVHVLRDRADTVRVEVDAAEVLVAARRRLVRGRMVRGAAATFVLGCAAAVGATLLAPGATKADPPVATQSLESGTFSTGSLIRRDGADLLMPSSVTSYVRVPAGIVFTTGDGRVQLLPPRSTDPQTIGTTRADAPHLVADPTHNQVAWVSHPRGSSAFVVYDVARGTQRTVFSDSGAGGGGDGADQVRVYAVDGDTLYARDSRGAVQVDLRTEREKVLSLEADDGTVGSVAGGAVAWRSPVPSKGYVVGPRFGVGVPSGRHDSARWDRRRRTPWPRR
jgi:hypothetical protein